MNKIAFVVPWYGETIPGGAEMEMRETAKHLKEAGMEVEILTTCVKEFSADWNENYHKEGWKLEGEIPVRRFKVRKRDVAAFDQVNGKLMNQIPISRQEEEVFIQEMINSPELYQYISRNQKDYEYFIYIPYMFGTTYYGIKACPQKAIMIPCFHDEAYAYLKIFQELFSKVRGMIFNAEPEAKLAYQIYDLEKVDTEVFGIGMDSRLVGNKEHFIKKYRMESPFLLYAGRKDAGKNVDLLIRYFEKYKQRNRKPWKLVLIGGGQIEIPDSMKNEIYDFGFLSPQEKADAYTACEVLCQPSKNESFSFVIMESWLCKRPVLVNGACAVTKDFVCQSNGGLYFENYYEFEACINYFDQNPSIAQQMGQNGRQYVLNHFSWEVMVQKYRNFFEKLKKMGEGNGVERENERN